MTREEWYRKAIDYIKEKDMYPSIVKIIGYDAMCKLSNKENKIAEVAILDAIVAHREAYLKAHPLHAAVCSSASPREALRIWKEEGGSAYLDTL